MTLRVVYHGKRKSIASVLAFVIGWRAHGWGSRRHRASLIDRPRCSRKLARKLCFANEIRLWVDATTNAIAKFLYSPVVFVQLVNQRMLALI